MPAATPKPSLEDLLVILSRYSGLRLHIRDDKSSRGDIVELCFEFRVDHLGPAADWVFKNPSAIFPALKDYLEYDDVIEKAYRSDDPRNTVEDCINYLQQKRAYIRVLNGLSDRMDAAFFDSTLKYLRELDRRRREADRRIKEAEESRRKRQEEEIKRRVEEEIRQREQERAQAKAEAHRRWEEEEAQKRRWQQQRTSDSGYDRAKGGGPQYENPFEEMFRAAGVDPNDPIFRSAFEANWGAKFSNAFYGDFRSRKSPPPSPGGKRKWYDILGCSPGASRDEIRRAARAAAKGMHPDKPEQDTPENQRKIREINEAKAEGLQGCAS